MKQFYTSVLERKNTYTADFQTEPYEVAWASEALFFINVEEMNGRDVQLQARAQISPDGINWIDEGTSFGAIHAAGLHFVRLSHFGGWLRLVNELTGENAEVLVTIHLVLKE